MAGDDWKYDVVVLYAYGDRSFVRQELLPLLHSWSLAYAVDFNDFMPGKRGEDEVKRLLESTRIALVVVSASWLTWPRRKLESDLVRRLSAQGLITKTVLLPIDDTAVHDFGRCEIVKDRSWNDLVRAILPAVQRVAHRPLIFELRLCRKVSEDGFQGYAYAADVSVVNPLPVHAWFDSVELRYLTSGMTIDGFADSLTLAREGGRIQASYGYAALKGFEQEHRPAGHPGGFELPPQAVKTIGTVELLAPPSVAGKSVIEVSVHVAVSGIRTSDSCFCVLPNVRRLPDISASERLTLKLPRETTLPSNSGMLDYDLVRRAFATARRQARNAVLASVTPRSLTAHQFASDVLHSCQGWAFVFVEVAGGKTIEVQTLDPEWSHVSPGIPPSNVAPLSEDALADCLVDSRAAYLIARSTATGALERVFPRLTAEEIDGDRCPLWQLPLQRNGDPIGVLASDAALATGKGGHWRRATS
jgi:hypothetical protein